MSCGFWSGDQLSGATCCILLQIWSKHIYLDAAILGVYTDVIHRRMKLDEARFSETSMLTYESLLRQNAVDYHLQVLGIVKLCDSWIHGEMRRVTDIHFLIGIYAQPRADSKLCIYVTYKKCNQFLFPSVCFSLLYTSRLLSLIFSI